MPRRFRPVIHLWLHVRNARTGSLIVGGISVVTCLLADKSIAAPLGALMATPFDIPIGSIAPVMVAMTTGFLLQFQLPGLERASIRPIAMLDAALLVAYSLILLVPSSLFKISHDADAVFSAGRAHVVTLWVTVLGSYLVGTRMSVVATTAGLLLAPTLLPSHLRDNPPGLFIPLPRGDSWEATLIAALVISVGVGSVCWKGLPSAPQT